MWSIPWLQCPSLEEKITCRTTEEEEGAGAAQEIKRRCHPCQKIALSAFYEDYCGRRTILRKYPTVRQRGPRKFGQCAKW